MVKSYGPVFVILRFMWFVFVAAGFGAAIYIIQVLYERYQTNPTITGLDTDSNSQLLIFPTVMLCPAASYDTNQINRMAENELKYFQCDFIISRKCF